MRGARATTAARILKNMSGGPGRESLARQRVGLHVSRKSSSSRHLGKQPAALVVLFSVPYRDVPVDCRRRGLRWAGGSRLDGMARGRDSLLPLVAPGADGLRGHLRGGARGGRLARLPPLGPAVQTLPDQRGTVQSRFPAPGLPERPGPPWSRPAISRARSIARAASLTAHLSTARSCPPCLTVHLVIAPCSRLTYLYPDAHFVAKYSPTTRSGGTTAAWFRQARWKNKFSSCSSSR